MSKLAAFHLPKPSNDRFNAIDPLDSRYYDAEVATYLSENARIAYQAYVEAALARTLADFGICSETIAAQIEKAASKVTAQAVYKEEQVTKHDIKALVNCIKKEVPNKAKPYVHFGATSYDIIATANGLQLKAVTNEVVVPRLKALIKTLLDLTKKYADTKQIGRTHGQHAVPITFGFAMAEYVERLGDSLLRIKELSRQLHGEFSGAVGAYNALSVFVNDPLKFEKSLLHSVGLEPAPYSTQIIPAENIIRLIDELAITAGVMANLAHDMRHLQRSEIAEVHERFEKGQTGSSTMPQKQNPINFENVISLAKQVTAQMVNANLNVSSEHQRDLTDSASSRFYTLVFASVASMTERLNKVMSKLEVSEENMERNLHLSEGAIASEPFYLLLEKYGETTAHEKAKAVAHAAKANHFSLQTAIERDAQLTRYWDKFTSKERQLVTNPEKYYTGLANKKAKTIYSNWQKKL